jgi:putative cell wall-binding protein
MKAFTKTLRMGKRGLALSLAAIMLVSNVSGVATYASTTSSYSSVVTASAVVEVALNKGLTGSKVTFAGGSISKDKVPTVNNAVFEGAYIWLNGNQNNSVPINYLTTSNGQVLYMVNGSNSIKSAQQVGMMFVKGANDKVVFAYTSVGEKQSTQYTVSYNIKQVDQADLTAIGGHVKLVSDLKTIGANKDGYFQLVRTGGTNLSVSATNGTVTKVSTSKSGLVETWKISGVTKNTTINITESWKQSNYNVKLNVNTPSLPEGTTSYSGRVIMKTFETVKQYTGGSNENSAVSKWTANTKAEWQIGFGGAVYHTTNKGTITDNWAKFGYVANAISYKGTETGHQVLASVTVDSGNGDAETVFLPKSMSTSDSTSTTLTKGEKAGTIITIRWWGYETAGDGIKIPVYDVQVGNVHTNIYVNLNYVNSTSRNLTLQASATGVEVKQGDSTFTDGQMVTPDSSVKILYKASRGYYNPKLTIGNSSFYDNVANEGTSGGYYTYTLSALENDPVVSVTVDSTPITYKVSYNANGGTYADGNPTDTSKVYKVNRDGGANANSVVLVSNNSISREGYIFAGYKIAGNAVDTTLWQNSLIDLNDTNAINLSYLGVDANGNATITLEAQWVSAAMSTASLTTVKYNEVMTDAATKHSTTAQSTFAAPVGVEYKLVGYAADINGYKLTGDVVDSGVTSSYASQNIITLNYVKPTGSITANNFTLTLSEAKAMIKDSAALVAKAGAVGLAANGSQVSVSVRTNNMKAEAGSYTITFEAANDEKSIVVVKVTVLGESLEASNFIIDAKDVETLTDAKVLELSEAKAWSGDNTSAAVDISVTKDIKATSGDYKVTLTTAGGVTKEITVTVIGNKSAAGDSSKPSAGSSSKPSVEEKTTSSELVKASALVRYSGTDRVATSLAVADAMKSSATSKFGTIIVASANSFADALSGSYLAYVTDAPIITVNVKNYNTVEKYIKANLAENGTVYILGGTGVVESNFEKMLTTATSNGAAISHVNRLSGSNRYLTNISILKEAFAKAQGTSKLDKALLVCSGNDYADSLSASATKKPIILVDKAQLSGSYLKSEQSEYLKTLSLDNVTIIGGTGAVVSGVENELKSLLNKDFMYRIAGANRYETSVLIAETFFNSSKVNAVTFAYGLDFPDGLSAGPFAIKNGSPLILIAGTAADVANSSTFFTTDARVKYAKGYVDELKGSINYSIIGGTGVIPKALAESLTSSVEQ